MDGRSADGSAALGTRWPEVVVAGALVMVAGLVIADSLRVGIGWADDGPRSGCFPFYIGLLLLASSSTVLIKALFDWGGSNPPFAEPSQLTSVAAVFIPMVAYVGSIALLGIYVSSLLLIGYFMRRHGRYGWPLTLAVGTLVPLTFFLVFERWFLVLLPKGPLERLLGL